MICQGTTVALTLLRFNRQNCRRRAPLLIAFDKSDCLPLPAQTGLSSRGMNVCNYCLCLFFYFCPYSCLNRSKNLIRFYCAVPMELPDFPETVIRIHAIPTGLTQPACFVLHTWCSYGNFSSRLNK